MDTPELTKEIMEIKSELAEHGAELRSIGSLTKSVAKLTDSVHSLALSVQEIAVKQERNESLELLPGEFKALKAEQKNALTRVEKIEEDRDHTSKTIKAVLIGSICLNAFSILMTFLN